MLQQTQVSVVVSYFERWMDLFPTISDLAKASIDDVIKAWEGLGYYSRARNIHVAARYMVENHAGEFPEKLEDWTKIKGLGPYTIAAIAAFAFHKKTAPVDGNVYRVLARYFKIEEDLDKTQTKKELQKIALEILPSSKPWIHGEALIELGAKVCKKKPNCTACPLKNSCKAYRHGLAYVLPIKTKKVVYEKLERSVALLICGDRVCVKRCEKNKIMSDLHEFLYFEVNVENSMKDPEKIMNALKEKGLSPLFKRSLEEVSHSFTKYRVKLFPYIFEIKNIILQENVQWVPFQELQKLAFSSGHKRILQNFLNTLGINE